MVTWTFRIKALFITWNMSDKKNCFEPAKKEVEIAELYGGHVVAKYLKEVERGPSFRFPAVTSTGYMTAFTSTGYDS